MKQRYVSIAAAVLAALVVGTGPTWAQMSAPGGTMSPTVGPNTGVSPSTGNQHTNTDAHDNGAVNDESPSASPRGDDNATSRGDQSDEQRMKDQQRQMEQIDRNSAHDLADNSK